MLIAEPLPFIKAFVEDLNDALKQIDPDASLSRSQKGWIAFCCLGILVTNSVCWARLERWSLGKYTLPALSWMFRRARIRWELLLHGGVKAVLKKYRIYKGIMVIDDSEKKRSKSTKRIFRVHKLKDKSSGGYIMGQSLVLLVLVTERVTLPVGFAFYMPDPALTVWYKLRNEAKKAGPGKKRLPRKPKRNSEYPTKQGIALSLLREFRVYHPEVQIKCVVADALYGTDLMPYMELMSFWMRLLGFLGEYK
jgi:SRSO17 transposase